MSLEADVQTYYAAMRSEFVDAKNGDKLDSIIEEVKNDIRNLLPQAAATLSNLMQYAESEPVRLRAATYVLDNGLFGADTPEDELARLVRSMQSKK